MLPIFKISLVLGEFAMETVLVTGANRGIGLEFVRQFTNLKKQVVACCRNVEQAKELNEFAQKNDSVSVYELDVTKQAQIDKLSKELSSQPIDYLINNAGIYGSRKVTLGSLDPENFLNVMEVNCLATLKVSEAFLDQLAKSQKKMLVTISSQMGSITDNDSGGSYAYRASKAALNAVMRSFAIDTSHLGVNVMTLHPGWVKTDMGGGNAFISTTESVLGMIEQIEKHGKNDHAQIFRRFDGKTIGW